MSDASAWSDVGGLHAERSWRVSRFLSRLGTSDCRGSVQQRLPGHGTQNSGVSTLDVEMSSGSGSISGSGGSDSIMGPGSGSISVLGGSDSVMGPGSDSIFGSGGSDSAMGLSSDSVSGLGGFDSVIGSGSDSVVGPGFDFVSLALTSWPWLPDLDSLSFALWP